MPSDLAFLFHKHVDGIDHSGEITANGQEETDPELHLQQKTRANNKTGNYDHILRARPATTTTTKQTGM